MHTPSRIATLFFTLVLALGFQQTYAAGADAFASIKTQADLDALITATSDAATKQAIRDNAVAILAAAEQRPHVEAVIHTLESAPGKFEKVNTTPQELKKATGGDVAIFDTLKLVDLSVANMGPHDHRKFDPFDAAFFEHLSHITALESLNVISTQANDEWIAPLAKLTNLKSLHFTNNGKLSDAGLEHFAGMRQMENFGFVGTAMKGHAFAKFEGWTKLTRASFRGSSIDDEGLQLLCERFPNFESISLAHAHFTDAAAVNFEKLTKLKGLEIGSHNATPQCLRYLTNLPLEYLQLGEGVGGPQSIPLIKDMKSLRRVTFTDAKGMTDSDLKLIAGMTHLQSLEFSNLDIPDERVPQMQAFSFLKALRLVHQPKPYSDQIQAQLKPELPHVTIKFD